MFIGIKSFKILPIFILTKWIFSHLIVMKNYFKAFKVKILSSFLFLQISKFIFGFIPKQIETLVWIEQQTCGFLWFLWLVGMVIMVFFLFSFAFLSPYSAYFGVLSNFLARFSRLPLRLLLFFFWSLSLFFFVLFSLTTLSPQTWIITISSRWQSFSSAGILVLRVD